MFIRIIGSYFFFLCVITLYYFRYVDLAFSLLAGGVVTLILVHRAMSLTKEMDEELNSTRVDKGID